MPKCDQSNTRVGDIVECIDNSGGFSNSLTVGKTYKVESMGTWLNILDNQGKESGWNYERFKLPNTPEPYLGTDEVEKAPLPVFVDEVAVPLTVKDTNPKDAVGIRKIPISTVSAPVLGEVGVAMLEGARKYGRHNYRVASVRASVYYDAAFRHMSAWWEGQDIDPESGLSHVTKAIAGLIVLRDAMIQDKFVDDRPPASNDDWQKNLQPVIDAMFERHPNPVPAYTQKN